MWRRKRYPRKRGTRERRRTPPRLHHVSTVGRKRSKPFAASWSWTSCSQLLLVQRTRQGGVTDSATASDKASPPLVSTLPSVRDQLLITYVRRATGKSDRAAASPPVSPRDLTSVVRGGLSPACAAPKKATLPSASVSVGGSPRDIRVTSRDVAIVAVENQAHNLGRLRDVQRFFEELAGRPVSRHHDEEAIHPFAENPTVGNRHEWRGVDDDVVISPASLRQELPEPGRLQP